MFSKFQEVKYICYIFTKLSILNRHDLSHYFAMSRQICSDFFGFSFISFELIMKKFCKDMLYLFVFILKKYLYFWIEIFAVLLWWQLMIRFIFELWSKCIDPIFFFYKTVFCCRFFKIKYLFYLPWIKTKKNENLKLFLYFTKFNPKIFLQQTIWINWIIWMKNNSPTVLKFLLKLAIISQVIEYHIRLLGPLFQNFQQNHSKKKKVVKY